MNKFVSPSKMQRSLGTGHPIELVPASLLPYRGTWQPLVESMPKHAYLIVTTLDRQPDTASVRTLVNSLRRQGQLVYVLSVG